MSTGRPAQHRSASTSSRPPPLRSVTPIDPRTNDFEFEPCASTAYTFLFAQGSSVICLHHDTLALDRKFELHKEKILILSVDVVSDRGAGRYVVSYDAGQTAIVWDVGNGNEIARFASYEPIKVAAWMKNGNIAFGNSQGNVILFEPTTSEHISARTIFDPITAIAPAWDCQTYAIGYQNGSILIATLQPNFTILHTLTTARAPSPIVNLAWHASSSKQKSDMLATQTLDGGLRVWSVAKPPVAEVPKTIRILKRSDNVEPGLNWLAWSKNGRVLQYTDGETWSWDVRTKHIQCETIPTVEGVRGLANYGSQAILFTLGRNHTVQQYELSPPRLVKEMQFNPKDLSQITSKSTKVQHIPGTAPPLPVQPTRPESGLSSHSTRPGSERSGPASLSMIQKTANEMSAIEQARVARSDMRSPMSTASHTDTVSSLSSNRMVHPRQGPLSMSTGARSGTTFSTMSPSMLGRDSMVSGTSLYPSTYSLASSGRRSKGSRLRQEVLRSPETHYIDLFPRTRSRLANVAYKEPSPIDPDSMSPDELRRQMLDVVFGWSDDIEPLIRDELFHHRQGSNSAVLLAKWLGEVDSDMMAAAISTGNVNSSDWMVLALSSMGGNSAMTKMAQALVQRLLQQGDFHTSATILLGMGDLEDAVEVYVSRCFYMEAILLTSLIFPQDWQRQAHLVQKWGEFVVENSQQNLAMRCFYATGVDPPLPWGSPSPKMIDSQSQSRAPSSIGDILSPPISPPPLGTGEPRRGPSLKVMTSFGKPMQQKLNVSGPASFDRTPTDAPGVTPIAESAMSAGGTPGGFIPHPLRAFNRGNTPRGAFSRQRLPSIGEMPVDVTLPLASRPSQLPTPDNSGSDLEKEKERQSKPAQTATKAQLQSENIAPLLLTSARYEPTTPSGQSLSAGVPQTSVRTTIFPDPKKDPFTVENEYRRTQNASREGKPHGLHIRMPSQDQIRTIHTISDSGISSKQPELVHSTTLNPLHSGGLSTGGLSVGGLSTGGLSTGGLSTGGLSTGGLSTGGLSTGRQYAKSPSLSGTSASAKSPSVSSRSIDQYINSLDEARSNPRKQKHRSRKRHESRDGEPRSKDTKSRSKHRASEQSEDRGREGRETRRYIRPAKRSPSSPVPMSPETYAEHASTPGLTDISGAQTPDLESRTGRSESGRQKGLTKYRSGSKASDFSNTTVRHRSPAGAFTSGVSSRISSRQPSPRAMVYPDGRGRSDSKTVAGSAIRSPSSPLPFSPQAKYYQDSDGDDDPARLVEANRQRIRSRHRSSSRKSKGRGPSSRREASVDRSRRHAERQNRASETDQRQSQVTSDSRQFSGEESMSTSDRPAVHRQKSVRTQKKELAQAELEARRESLLRNPEAPIVPHPNEYSHERPTVNSRAQTDLSNSPTSHHPIVSPINGRGFSPMQTMASNGDIISRSGAASVGAYGLPATPRAMRHPRYDNKEAIPSVPEFPEKVPSLPESYYSIAKEIPRSMSAPEPQMLLQPSELPPHPAFHRGLKQQEKRSSNFQSLDSIGQHRRKASGDQQSMMHPPVAGIDETLRAAEREDPPMLPELQHLNLAPPPPPPPPPPVAPFGNHDADSSSLSSNSHVGMIQVVLDNEPEDEANVIEVPPPPPPRPAGPPPHHSTQSVRSASSVNMPPPSVSRSSSTHRRGRSGDQSGIQKGIKGITDRLRSSSRGRMTKSPEQSITGPVPYESVPPLYF